MKYLNLTQNINFKKMALAGLGATLALALSLALMGSAHAAAPFVSVASPVTGSEVVRGSTVEIVAEAFDDVAVTQLDFYVNNRLVCTGATGLCVWQVPTKGKDTFNVEVRAYDADGNVSVANAIYTAIN